MNASSLRRLSGYSIASLISNRQCFKERTVALTSLDPQTALLIIDLQRGVVSLPLAHPVAEVVKNARALADAFRAHRLPVVLVNVAGIAPGRTEQVRHLGNLPAGWTDLIPELGRQATDQCITKYTSGAFAKTGLEEQLLSQGVTQVVLAGISSSNGVESTARQAYELGFHATLAIDAMTDAGMDAHVHSLTKIFPRLGESGTTQQVLNLLNSARV
jgi:nicotinamidase-related amidase